MPFRRWGFRRSRGFAGFRVVVFARCARRSACSPGACTPRPVRRPSGTRCCKRRAAGYSMRTTFPKASPEGEERLQQLADPRIDPAGDRDAAQRAFHGPPEDQPGDTELRGPPKPVRNSTTIVMPQRGEPRLQGERGEEPGLDERVDEPGRQHHPRPAGPRRGSPAAGSGGRLPRRSPSGARTWRG